MIDEEFETFLNRAIKNAKEAIIEANPDMEDEHLSTHSDEVYSDKISSMIHDFSEATCICRSASFNEKSSCQEKLKETRIKISELLAGIGIFE